MRTFSLIIEHTAPSQHVFDILHGAWDVCRESCGLECEYEFLRSSKPVYWPRRSGYDHMGNVLLLYARTTEVARHAPVVMHFRCGKPLGEEVVGSRFLWP